MVLAIKRIIAVSVISGWDPPRPLLSFATAAGLATRKITVANVGNGWVLLKFQPTCVITVALEAKKTIAANVASGLHETDHPSKHSHLTLVSILIR